MFFSLMRGRVRHSLFQIQTRDEQAMARLNGYLGALR